VNNVVFFGTGFAVAVTEAIDTSSTGGWVAVGGIALVVGIAAGNGIKTIIEWAVRRFTAEDGRIVTLEADRRARELEDRARLTMLEKMVEALRKEILQMHEDLRMSEVRNARLEGELKIWRASLDEVKLEA